MEDENMEDKMTKKFLADMIRTFMDYIVTTNNIDLSPIRKSRSRMFEDIVLNNGS